jgi:hypothetical protein
MLSTIVASELSAAQGNRLYDPSNSTLRYGLPQSLQQRFQPYMGASFRVPSTAGVGVGAEQRLRTQMAERRCVTTRRDGEHCEEVCHRLQLANQSISELRREEERNKAMLQRCVASSPLSSQFRRHRTAWTARGRLPTATSSPQRRGVLNVAS